MIKEFDNDKRVEKLLKDKALKREQDRKELKARIGDIKEGDDHDLIELCRVDLEALGTI